MGEPLRVSGELKRCVQSKINIHVGLQEPLLTTVKRRKLAWFRHITCHDSLYKTILQGTSVEEMFDGQHQGVDIPAHVKTAHKGLLQKRLEEGLC